jgi:hypothetical protein
MVEDLAMHGPIKHEELRGLVGKETLDGALDLNPKLKEFMDPPKME